MLVSGRVHADRSSLSCHAFETAVKKPLVVPSPLGLVLVLPSFNNTVLQESSAFLGVQFINWKCLNFPENKLNSSVIISFIIIIITTIIMIVIMCLIIINTIVISIIISIYPPGN